MVFNCTTSLMNLNLKYLFIKERAKILKSVLPYAVTGVTVLTTRVPLENLLHCTVRDQIKYFLLRRVSFTLHGLLERRHLALSTVKQGGIY